jgi:hypothetical protein
MHRQALAQRLAEGIDAARRSTNFCVGGVLPKIDPDIEVAEVGPLKLPLRSAPAKRLMAACQPAPYGKGTQTLVNRKVRNSFELAPAKFKLANPEWDEVIRTAVRTSAEQLGLPVERLEPKLYKLLAYGKGGFFLPHRDSEKTDRMMASLIVALPTPFEGGRLTVRHRNATERFDFTEAAGGQAPSFVAFYADCEHEVARVTHGFRLCLAYNLVLKKSKGKKRPTHEASLAPAEALARSISQWIAAAEAEPLTFALDHHYSQRGLSLELLKGTDRATADLVVAAAERAGCRAYLCQVSRHLSQFADDGTWERGGYWGRSRRYGNVAVEDLELGEVYEDELIGQEWVDAAGKRRSFPEIGLSPEAIIASTPLDQWKPTREEYEGYTGNAGNTLDRWYHRSAVCIWPHDRHYEVLARGGVAFAVELLRSMLAKLKKAPKKRVEELRGECLQLARAIIGRWPKSYDHHAWRQTYADPELKAFPEMLVEFDDLDATRQFLGRVAERDPNQDVSKLVVAMCRRQGCAALSGELREMFKSHPNYLSLRNIAWLDRLVAARIDDAAAGPLIDQLARLAADQFCQPQPEKAYYDETSSLADKTLPPLIRTLLASGDDETLESVIRFVRMHPERFSFEKVQVPTLERIIASRRKPREDVHPLLLEWLRSLQKELQATIAREPQPPADWGRPAEVGCSCTYCQEFKQFLADPSAETGRIKAPEERRSHLLAMIDKHRCDVTHKLEKRGSPYALVFAKTTGSYQRQVQRHALDRKLQETVETLLSD